MAHQGRQIQIRGNVDGVPTHSTYGNPVERTESRPTSRLGRAAFSGPPSPGPRARRSVAVFAGLRYPASHQNSLVSPYDERTASCHSER
jgi:hypothetical protein